MILRYLKIPLFLTWKSSSSLPTIHAIRKLLPSTFHRLVKSFMTSTSMLHRYSPDRLHSHHLHNLDLRTFHHLHSFKIQHRIKSRHQHAGNSPFQHPAPPLFLHRAVHDALEKPPAGTQNVYTILSATTLISASNLAFIKTTALTLSNSKRHLFQHFTIVTPSTAELLTKLLTYCDTLYCPYCDTHCTTTPLLPLLHLQYCDLTATSTTL